MLVDTIHYSRKLEHKSNMVSNIDQYCHTMSLRYLLSQAIKAQWRSDHIIPSVQLLITWLSCNYSQDLLCTGVVCGGNVMKDGLKDELKDGLKDTLKDEMKDVMVV